MVKQPLTPTRFREPHDDYEHMCLAIRLVYPAECIMRKVDANTQIPQRPPNIGYLLALTNAVSGNEGATHRAITHILRSFHIPARNVIHVAAILRAAEHVHELGLLLLVLIARTQKRRVTAKVSALLRRQHVIPVHTKSVALVDVAIALQRQEVERL